METGRLDEKSIKDFKKTFNIIKNLKEEKKSISEDIAEEKKELSKKTSLPVKDINSILKILEEREKGEYSEDYIKIAKSVEGISAPPPTS